MKYRFGMKVAGPTEALYIQLIGILLVTFPSNQV
jgi:hypothetical protein